MARKPRAITEELIPEIEALRAKGVSFSKIAEQLEITKSRAVGIYDRWCRPDDYERKRRPPKPTFRKPSAPRKYIPKRG